MAPPEGEEAARQELAAAQAQAQAVRDSIQSMKQHHPELTDVLYRVQALLDVARVEEGAQDGGKPVGGGAAASGAGAASPEEASSGRHEERKAEA